jgi:hypothetical protein
MATLQHIPINARIPSLLLLLLSSLHRPFMISEHALPHMMQCDATAIYTFSGRNSYLFMLCGMPATDFASSGRCRLLAYAFPGSAKFKTLRATLRHSMRQPVAGV